MQPTPFLESQMDSLWQRAQEEEEKRRVYGEHTKLVDLAFAQAFHLRYEGSVPKFPWKAARVALNSEWVQVDVRDNARTEAQLSSTLPVRRRRISGEIISVAMNIRVRTGGSVVSDPDIGVFQFRPVPSSDRVVRDMQWGVREKTEDGGLELVDCNSERWEDIRYMLGRMASSES
jgi:hypothetical protein